MSMLSTSVLRGVDEIGPYQILEDLGPAPFGLAYLALDSRTDQRTLLKVIPPSRPGLQQEETPWDVLLKETRALLRIHHRGIPPMYEIAQQGGTLLVSFGAVTGSTLHDLMIQGTQPNRGLLVDWGCQLLDILAEAHAAGIVHRHVSEDQIVVTPDGRLVLMGFGLTQIHCDPLAAFPPEHSSGEPFTPQSDLHAVGLLLRRLAFASGLRGERGLGAPRRDPLLKVLARASFPNPAARVRDAREMAEALRQAGRAGAAPVCAPRPVRAASPAGPGPVLVRNIARLPVPRPEPQKVVRDDSREDRKLALLLLTAALILLLMLVAAGWFLIGRDAKAPAAPSSRSYARLQEEDHLPEPVDLAALHDLQGLEPLERRIGTDEPSPETFRLDHPGQCFDQADDFEQAALRSGIGPDAARLLGGHPTGREPEQAGELRLCEPQILPDLPQGPDGIFFLPRGFGMHSL